MTPAGDGRLARPAAVFWICFAAYLATWGGHYTSGDGWQKIAWAKALLTRASADIDPGPDVAHSKYGIGHTLLAIPPIGLATAVERVTGRSCEAAVYTLLFILNGAAFLYLVSRYLQGRYDWRRIWTVVLILGFSTSWWPYTKLDYSEPLVLTFLFWGFLLFRQGRDVAGALTASVALTIRPDAGVLVLILCAWHVWRRARRGVALWVSLALLPALTLHAVAAYVRYGSAVASYPGEFFENPLLVGLYGLLFSAGKSVFLFSPPLILGCVGLRRFMRTPQGREDGVLFLLLFGAQLAIAAKWWDWSGDDAWGPRFMIPAAVLLTIPIVELLDARRLVAAFALAGTAVQLLAVLVPGLDYVLVVHQHDMRRKALYVEGRNRVDFEDVRYNPRYSQINGHWQMLKARVGFRAGRDSDADAGREERVGTDLTDTLPPEFWQAQRGFDLFWWRLLTGEVTLNRDRGASEGPRRGPPY